MKPFPHPEQPIPSTPARLIPKAVWLKLEKAGWPRHCRSLIREGKSSALYFAIFNELPREVWAPLVAAGEGLDHVVFHESGWRPPTPMGLAAYQGNLDIVKALIGQGARLQEISWGGTLWKLIELLDFKSPEQRPDFIDIAIQLLEAGQGPSGFKKLNPHVQAAIESAMSVFEQQKQDRLLWEVLGGVLDSGSAAATTRRL
jgi:hypothetical protein